MHHPTVRAPRPERFVFCEVSASTPSCICSNIRAARPCLENDQNRSSSCPELQMLEVSATLKNKDTGGRDEVLCAPVVRMIKLRVQQEFGAFRAMCTSIRTFRPKRLQPRQQVVHTKRAPSSILEDLLPDLRIPPSAHRPALAARRRARRSILKCCLSSGCPASTSAFKTARLPS